MNRLQWGPNRWGQLVRPHRRDLDTAFDDLLNRWPSSGWWAWKAFVRRFNYASWGISFVFYLLPGSGEKHRDGIACCHLCILLRWFHDTLITSRPL